MKLLTKLSAITASTVVFAGMSMATAFAANPGQVVGGDNNYQIQDLTSKSGYANTQSAAACDELQYRLKLYNPGPSTVTNVKVEAGINSVTPYTHYVSTATAYVPDGDPNQVSYRATLNISTAQTQSYEAGTTQLLNSAGSVIKTLPDGVTAGAGGISIGNIGESVTEYVTFKTKISCPPPTPAESCDLLQVTPGDHKVTIKTFNETATGGAVYKNVVITWGDNTTALTAVNPVGAVHGYSGNGPFTITATPNFTVNGQTVSKTGPLCVQKVSFTTPPKTPPQTPPTTLVNTGAGNVIGLFAAATAAGAFVYHRVLRRRLAE